MQGNSTGIGTHTRIGTGGGGGYGHHHKGSTSSGGSISRTAELTTAYASLATELTRKEIKTVGGYTLGKIIGEGSFGTVRIGCHRLTNTRVAIKQVPKSLPFSSDSSSPLSLLTREIHHHRRLRHPHILSLYEIIATETSIYLVTELCTGGELFDYLVEKGRLSPSETKRIFGQLVLGVAYLHTNGVVHRDLKLENILLDEKCGVKIADLGFGREFEKGRWMETWVGTLGYCAPEVVAAKRYLGEEVDIWSLGIILYTLLAGSLPFDDDDEDVMKAQILKCEYDIPSWMDEDAADLIRGILVLDPLRRLSLKSILSHRFFTRPPLIHHFDNRGRDLSPALPPAIPEEPASPPLMSLSSSSTPPRTSSIPIITPPSPRSPTYPHKNYHHSVTTSDVSENSLFSTSASSDSEGREGATTPITSEEGSTESLSVQSAVREGKRKAVDQVIGIEQEEELMEDSLGLLHRNASQTTIRKSSEEARSLESTPKASSARPSVKPLGSTAEEESTIPTPYQAFLGLSAPRLQRNFSHDSSASLFSLNGSPIPPHNRTPSRTKRRSTGSSFSERMLTPAEDEFLNSHQAIDYLALLPSKVTGMSSNLSTPIEKDLLKSLLALGFDTGQITHSIRTHACDSSSAIWWILKWKAEQREADRLELERTSSRLKPRAGGSHSSRRTPLSKKIFFHHEDTGSSSHMSSEDEEYSPPPPIRMRPTSNLPLSTLAAKLLVPPDPSFSAYKRGNSSDEGSTYSLRHLGSNSASAPHLSLIPAETSPKKKVVPRSKSKDYLSASPSPTSSPVLFPLSSLPSTPPVDSEGGGNGKDGKGKRSRAGSVSILARATSVLGSTLALKKSTDGVKSETKVDEGGGLFGRKTSVTNLDEKATTPMSPKSSPSKSLDSSPIINELPGTPKSPQGLKLASPLSPPQTLPPTTSREPVQISRSIPVQQKSTSTVFSAKKPARGSLFSNFKMWFGDDRRKRGRKSASSHEGPSSRPGTLNRRGVRSDSSYASSPHRRPPLGSRRSSNTSAGPLSRRSSINSNHQIRLGDQTTTLSPTFGHQRRRSIGSRASDSEREHSRPPSRRSSSGPVDFRPTTKSGSISSVGSYRANHPAIVPPAHHASKEVYRRPAALTTVRRHHGPHRHTRNRSTSSNNDRRSSASSFEDDSDILGTEEPKAIPADPILEEDEGGEEDRAAEERQKALSKLSGETVEEQSSLLPVELSHSTAMASRPSLTDSQHSSTGSSRHGSITFSAHKTRHVFGAPSQHSTSSSSSTHSLAKKPQHASVRDIFATKKDGDWVDDDDEDAEYVGGLGQGGTNRRLSEDDSTPGTGGSSSKFPSSISIPPARTESPIAKSFGNSMFEGRYAGVVGPADTGSGASGVGGVGSWRGTAGRPLAFRIAAVCEEEEEEEEEE